MPNRRAYSAPSSWASVIQLNSRLYPVTTPSRTVKVSTRCVQHERYPFVESVLDHAVLQPYIHDCSLRVHEGGRWTSFLIFFKRHCRLPRNRGVFRGDLLVMRTSCNGKVINMRGRDRILANWAVERLACNRRMTRRVPPTSIDIMKSDRSPRYAHPSRYNLRHL